MLSGDNYSPAYISGGHQKTIASLRPVTTESWQHCQLLPTWAPRYTEMSDNVYKTVPAINEMMTAEEMNYATEIIECKWTRELETLKAVVPQR